MKARRLAVDQDRNKIQYFINRSKIPCDQFTFFGIDQNAEIVMVADFANHNGLLTEW